jgi:hypothetical protein
MGKTGFVPQVDSFAFINSWTLDQIEIAKIKGVFTDAINGALAVLNPAFGPALGALGLGGKLTDRITNALSVQVYGLCGGMAFAALDYYKAQWVVPTGASQSDQPTRDTPAGQTLKEYLQRRLVDSLRDNVATVLAWMAVLHEIPDKWPFNGGAPWLLAQSKQQWNELKKHIGADEPCPLALIGNTTSPFENHQVLAFDYDDPGNGTGTVYVYDMNCPGDAQTIAVDFRGQTLVATESCANQSRGPLQGFFCEKYAKTQPPLAVRLSQGISVSRPGPYFVGDSVELKFTAFNEGFSTCPPLCLQVTGQNLDTGQDTIPQGEVNASPLAGGQGHELVASFQLKGAPGLYRFSPRAYLGQFNGVDIWRTIPAGAPGTNDSLEIQVS